MPRLYRQTPQDCTLRLHGLKPGQTVTVTVHRVRRKPGGRSRGKKVRVVVEHTEGVGIHLDGDNPITDTNP
jgi:hypothetical protein